MVAKVCATVLVVLCAVPVTAPFPVVDMGTAPSACYDQGTASVSDTSPASPDDDAVTRQRADFHQQSRLYAVVDRFVPDATAAADQALAAFAASTPATPHASDLTVLRV